jgi:DNA (cytosine-5)-methyltransferase 1
MQGFPDEFEFCGSASEQIKQIGNAIPPPLAREFAMHIKDQCGFDSISKDSDGALLGYTLTKAGAMSPALRRTESLLAGVSEQPLLLV